MKEIVDNIQKSIYGPEYYQSLLTQPIGKSFKYFFALASLLVVFLTIISSIPLVANANKFAHEFPAKFFAYLPDDLRVTITNGVASTNVTEPYFLPIPDELKGPIGTKEEMINIAVIDTATPFSLNQFNSYKAALWLGRDQIAYRDNSGSVKIEELGKNTNFVLNEQKLRDFESRVSPYYGLVGPLIVIVIFLALCIGFLFNLAYLLFGALLIMLLGYLMKLQLSYAVSYKIGLHAITLTLLFDAMLSMSSIVNIRIPFLGTAIMLAVVYLNLKKVTFATTVASVAPKPEVVP